VLAATGTLTLYISPESVWFAAGAAVVTLGFAVWSCTLPLGAEQDHGHDHSHAGHDDDGHSDASAGPSSSRQAWGTVAVVSGGILSTAVVAGALLLPPASLSVQLALSRSTGESVLFAGSDVATLAAASDTSTFGIGEWAVVFGSAPRVELYDGAPVTLTGFLTPGPEGAGSDEARLTRLVITHCVIDAQPAAVPVALPKWESTHAVGEWIEVTGVVRADADGKLRIEPTEVTAIDEPGDPYEH